MEKILLQTILYTPSHKTHYWKKEGNQKAKKISKKEWLELHDLGHSEVLAPITKQLILKHL